MTDRATPSEREGESRRGQERQSQSRERKARGEREARAREAAERRGAERVNRASETPRHRETPRERDSARLSGWGGETPMVCWSASCAAALLASGCGCLADRLAGWKSGWIGSFHWESAGWCLESGFWSGVMSGVWMARRAIKNINLHVSCSLRWQLCTS